MTTNRAGALKRRGLGALNGLGCLALGLLWLLPFGWILSTSMRPRSEAFRVPPAFLPERLDFSNYAQVLRQIPVFRFMLNSFVIAIATVLLMLLFTAMAAYALARIDFPFKKLAMPLLLAGMMIPQSSTLVPLFYTMRDLGLMNSRWSVILLGIYYPVGLLLIHQFMATIPKSYDEAAYIDGAGRVRIFFLLMLPMSRSTLLVAGLMCFILSWNNFLVPLIFLSRVEDYTITLGVQFLRSSYTKDISVILAGVMLTLIPPALIYCFCQKYLMQGIITTGLKA